MRRLIWNYDDIIRRLVFPLEITVSIRKYTMIHYNDNNVFTLTYAGEGAELICPKESQRLSRDRKYRYCLVQKP
jgi:hypothetical protein